MAINVGPFQQVVGLNMGKPMRFGLFISWFPSGSGPSGPPGYGQFSELFSSKINGRDNLPDVRGSTSSNYPDGLLGNAIWHDFRKAVRDDPLIIPDSDGFVIVEITYKHSDGLESGSSISLQYGGSSETYTGGFGSTKVPIDSQQTTLQPGGGRTSPPTESIVNYHVRAEVNVETGEIRNNMTVGI